MTVKVFVGADQLNQPNPPSWFREKEAAFEIAKRLWKYYEGKQALYFLLINLRRENRGAMADMVVLTQYGLGVIEQKYYAGHIHVARDGTWYAGNTVVKGGAQVNRSPRDQVKEYAELIRERLQRTLLAKYPKLSFQTTVCFTHSGAMVNDETHRSVNEYYRQGKDVPDPRKIHCWEDFKVTTFLTIHEWINLLSFGEKNGPIPKLDSRTMLGIAAALRTVEWRDVYPLLEKPTYAFLHLMKGEDIEQIYPLQNDVSTVGRNLTDIILPEPYIAVHRGPHMSLTRSFEGVFIESCDADLEVYVDGIKIRAPMRLEPYNIITLGGSMSDVEVPKLLLVLDLPKIQLPTVRKKI